MFQRLALLNMKRSMRDYLIYFITLSLTAAFMYSFLALGFSEDILDVGKYVDADNCDRGAVCGRGVDRFLCDRLCCPVYADAAEKRVCCL